MEVLDTTIVNVALPQMAGNLGATFQEITWVSTGYILSNVVVLPMTAFFTVDVRPAQLSHGVDHALHRRVVPLRHVAHAGRAGALAHHAGRRRRGAAVDRAGDASGRSSRASSRAWCRRSSCSASSWRPRSARRSAAGSPTTTPGTGASSSTCRSASSRVFLVTTFLQDPPGHARRSGPVDWLGIGLLIVGLGSLQYVLEEGREKDWFSDQLIVRLTIVSVRRRWSRCSGGSCRRATSTRS